MWLGKKEADRWLKKRGLWCVTYDLYVKDEEIICWITPGRFKHYAANIKGYRMLVDDNDLDKIKLKCAIILEDMNLINYN